jgi:hypothetical protein
MDGLSYVPLSLASSFYSPHAAPQKKVVPRLLTPVYPGGDGTDGDGMAPNQQPGDDFPGFCAWLGQFPPEVK